MSGNLKPRLYVGIRCESRAKAEGKPLRDVFRALSDPTHGTHGKYYEATIGPFRTRKGAEFMRDYGAGNPHCTCVADAERIARTLKTQSEMCKARISWLDKQLTIEG